MDFSIFYYNIQQEKNLNQEGNKFLVFTRIFSVLNKHIFITDILITVLFLL